MNLKFILLFYDSQIKKNIYFLKSIYKMIWIDEENLLPDSTKLKIYLNNIFRYSGKKQNLTLTCT